MPAVFHPILEVYQDGRIDIDFMQSYQYTVEDDVEVYDDPYGSADLLDAVLGMGDCVSQLRNLADYIESWEDRP